MGEVAAGAGMVEARGEAAAARRRGAIRRRHLHLAGPGGTRRRPRHGGLRSAAAPAARGQPAGPRKREAKGSAGRAEMAAPPPPPPRRPTTSPARRASSWPTRRSRYLEKAVALRPHYADAMTYLGLVWRQNRFGCFADPVAWQQAVDRANEWQTRALRGSAPGRARRWRSRPFARRLTAPARARTQAALVRRCRSRCTAR